MPSWHNQAFELSKDKRFRVRNWNNGTSRSINAKFDVLTQTQNGSVKHWYIFHVQRPQGSGNSSECVQTEIIPV
ncbi:hypothetical protein AGABI2DRAFT_195239 [Agaricus bisporus var. bisporus H97]|uniref:hypothetical protein n=1 Tax=Agaricus bisporus var. bisporus (strain H97 / ATCC MYA-4626 / FGSC 10389) TaxID=936046 RepID=UPI00029F6703|nr:hypothetical protein AGABI2DRAFT_195239 [Agaricus bisporus var. bisporus H97]EKV43721.1 hypothetical protein AGABI2DRAFT_195239 [Agaricus bisporus var. bisporus H97]